MKKSIGLPLVCFLLASCTTNTVVILSPGQQQMQNERRLAAQRAAIPCRLPANERTKYIAAVPVSNASGDFVPQKAKNARVDGCAGVEFQLSADGTPIHLHILKESPRHYNFGSAAVNQLKLSKYKPTDNLNQWYYVTTSYVTSLMYAPKPPVTPQAAPAQRHVPTPPSAEI